MKRRFDSCPRGEGHEPCPLRLQAYVHDKTLRWGVSTRHKTGGGSTRSGSVVETEREQPPLEATPTRAPRASLMETSSQHCNHNCDGVSERFRLLYIEPSGGSAVVGCVVAHDTDCVINT